MKNLTKVAVIGTVGIPAGYGGFETLTEHLVEQLSDRFAFTVYCSKKKYTAEQRVKTYKGARLVYLPFQANGIQSIVYDCCSILHALFYADVLLILGVPGGILLPFVKLFTRKKIVVSIDGIEWKRSKWSKIARWYLFAAEWLAVKFSHADIADNESIQDYTAIRYKTLSNIIEYGADHTMRRIATEEDKNKYTFLRDNYAFKVCRIEPENNIHIVLEAFAEMPGYKLVMVGNWDNSIYGQQLKTKYSGYKNIFLIDPVYDQRTIDLLRSNATVYVHGHSAGGTNPSLVEAMHLQLPVVAYNVSYNRTTTEGKAFYFKTSNELVNILKNCTAGKLRENAEVMYRIASTRYTWPVIASKYEHLIKTVLIRSVKNSLVPYAGKKLSKKSLIHYELAHLESPSLFYEKEKI